MKQNRVLFVMMVTLLMAFALTRPASASDFRSDAEVIVGADEVIEDDLFIGGERVQVNGTVLGDLFVSGTDVTINGTVAGSLFVSGRTIVVNGQVDGSVYGGGYSIQLGPDAVVQRNMYVGAYDLTTMAGSVVQRDLLVGGYQAILNGEIQEDLLVGAAALELNGTVLGDVEADVTVSEGSQTTPFMPQFEGSIDPVEMGFRQGETAVVEGELNVETNVVADGATTTTASQIGRNILNQRLGELIALIVVGGLLIHFWPNMIQRTSDNITEEPVGSAGRGLLTLLVFSIGIPLVLMVLVALALVAGILTFGQLRGIILGLGLASWGMMVAVFFFTTVTVTKIIVSYVVGRWLLNRFMPEMVEGTRRDFVALVVGLILYELLMLIPVVGGLMTLVIILIGLGGIYFTFFAKPFPLIEDGGVMPKVA